MLYLVKGDLRSFLFQMTDEKTELMDVVNLGYILLHV